jgi:hypothetical protein
MRPPARWFFDADTVGTGKTVSTARADVTWPGDSGRRDGPERTWLPPSPIDRTEVPDREWIPVVTDHGMAIITRDKKILSRLLEVEAVRGRSAQMYVLEPDGAGNRWELLEIVVGNWRRMEAHRNSTPGPYLVSITRTGGLRTLRTW